MNKQTRLVVSFLFIVVIILAAAITHFYLSVPEGTAKKSSQTEIAHKYGYDGDGNYIFTDSTGKYGVADPENRIMIAPEWADLRFAAAGKCIATRDMGSGRLSGCVDYDGNTVVPLIYSRIERLNAGDGVYFAAESESDGRYVLYDSSFEPCFRRTWSSCTEQSGSLILADGGGTYTFSHSPDGLLFTRAAADGEAMGCPYSVEINSRVLLSKLTVSMIEDMTGITEKYIEYAFSGRDELLSGITRGSRAGFAELFPDDHRLLSKRLLGISDVHIYSVRGKDDTPCYEVAFAADTEIAYTDESGERQTLRGKYKAAVGFSGRSEKDMRALSGRFEKDAPDYPEPENETDNASDTTRTDRNTAV